MHRDMWALLLLIAFSVLIFTPALFFGWAFFGEEQIGFYYAISDYVRQSLASGTSLLWQSGYYGGVSASLDQFVGAWYPLNLFLFSIFPTFLAHHVSITIATAAGLIFTYAFGRQQGWRCTSSLVLALGYFAATTYAWLLIGTIAAHSFAMLPALLVALRCSKEKRWRVIAILGGGTALGIGFLAGFMQVVFYAYIVAGLYALFLDWETYTKEKSWWEALSASLSYTGMTMLGLVLGFRQFFPSAHLIDETIRTSTYAIQNAYQPLPTELIAFVMPPYFTVPIIGGGASAGFFIGALGFVFALFALTVYRTRSVVFFAVVYAGIAAVAFHLPVFSWLNEHIPPFSHMGGQFRWMLGAALPLAFIGAAGVEGFLHAPEKVHARAYRYVLWFAGALTAVLALGSIALQVVSQAIISSGWVARIVEWYGQRRALHYPAEHYQAFLLQVIRQVTDTFSLLNIRFAFGVLCWVIVAAFFLALRYKRIPEQHIASFIVGITLFTIGGSTVLQWSDLVPQAIYAEKPALVALFEEREKDPHAYRIMGYLLGDGYFQKLSLYTPLTPVESTRLQYEILTNNVNLYFGLERMDGMEPYRTLRANRLLNTVIGYDNAAYVFDDGNPVVATSKLDQLYNRDVQRRVSVEEKLIDLERRLPLLSMMNVKYLYTPYELADTRLKRIAAVPLSVSTSTPIYVYENLDVLPRLYMAKESRYVSQAENEALREVVAEKNFAARTWIECEACSEISQGSGTVQVVGYEPGVVDVEVRTQTGGWLVFSESYLPGWKAFVDAEAVPIYPANYLFQAIMVPKGTHHVSFVYEDVTVVQFESLLR